MIINSINTHQSESEYQLLLSITKMLIYVILIKFPLTKVFLFIALIDLIKFSNPKFFMF